jgi:4'-phosphopantetheinyl transferase
LNPIVVLYAQLTEKIPENAELQNHLQLLPEEMQTSILKYQDKHEQRLRLGGKLLLAQILSCFNLDHLLLKNISKSGNNKPYLPSSDFQFNLAHSGNVCVCAGTTNADIGIDIEQIKPINVTHFQPYLTTKEQTLISDNAAAIAAFYEIWVKKEAVLKATGGMSDTELLNKIETQYEPVKFNRKEIYTKYIYLEESYVTCLASGKKINTETFVVKKIDLGV